MAWHTWHCRWNSSWFSFFFQYNININIYIYIFPVKSHYIQYLIHPRYDHLLQVIFLVQYTSPMYSQFSVELGKFTT